MGLVLVHGGVPDTTLPGSFLPIQSSGVKDSAHRASVSRYWLNNGEWAASLDFEVVLKMRNFDQLEAHIAKGEQISPAQMASTYEPLPSDYAKVEQWLKAQGFHIVQRDPHHVTIFGWGSVTKISAIFGVAFARVAVDGQEYSSAINAPSVPTDLASLLVGVNGLQPHRRLHGQAVQSNLTANASSAYTPAQILAAYGGSNLTQTGAGQTIAIVTDTFPTTADLAYFYSNTGSTGSINNVQFINVPNGTLPSASGEETLDVEWSSAMAPAAQIRDYAAGSRTDVAFDQAYARVYQDLASNPGMRQMSVSFGEGELYTTLSSAQTQAQYFAELAAAGVTIFVASGDGGSSPGVSGQDHTGNIQAECPASDVNVTGVGGTTMSYSTATGTVTIETAWADSGGGLSTYFSRPSWQQGAGVPAGSMRVVPDVAANADPATGYVVWLHASAVTYGGTSVASPVWAGFCARINQARAASGKGSLGLLNPQIYPYEGSACFRDITSGSNGPSPYYNAGVGYDPCTGLGVPNMAVLLPVLNGTLGSIIPTISSAGTSSGTINAAFTYQLTATNSPSGFTIVGPLPLGLSLNPDTGLISGTPLQGGTFVLTVGATNTWGTGTRSLTIYIAGQPQTIAAFAPIADQPFAGAPFTITPPTASSGLPVTLKILSGPATISGNTITPTVSGTVIVAADQAGNTDYTAAPEVTTSFAVTGNYYNAPFTPSSTLMNFPTGVNYGRGFGMDANGNGYAYGSGMGTDVVYQFTPGGAVNEVFDPPEGYQGGSPDSIAFDSSGHAYIAYGNSLVETPRYAPIQLWTNPSSSSFCVAVSTGGAVYAVTSASIYLGSSSEFGSALLVPHFVHGIVNDVVVDGGKNLFVATDEGSGYAGIFKVTPGGTVITLVSANANGNISGPIGSARFVGISGLAVDGNDNIYLNDTSGLRVITPGGWVSTISATGLKLFGVFGLTVDSAGDIYVGDQTIVQTSPPPVRITKLVPPVPSFNQAYSASGTVNTPFSFQLPALNFPISYSLAGTLPAGLNFDSSTGLISGTPTQSGIFALTAGATNGGGTGSTNVTLTIGEASVLSNNQNTSYTSANLSLNSVILNTSFGVSQALTLDGSGSFYTIASSSLYKISPTGVVTTSLLPSGGTYYASAAVDNTGNIYAVSNFGLSKFTAQGAQTSIPVAWPIAVAVDKDNNTFVTAFSSTAEPSIYEITPAGTLSTLVDTPRGPGGENELFNITALTVDGSDNVYAVAQSNEIYKITPGGTTTLLAGGPGSGNQDGTGSTARFGTFIPALAVDGRGNIYVADANNNAIRLITPDSTVSTISVTGDTFSNIGGVAVAPSGVLYVASTRSDQTVQIAKLTPPAPFFSNAMTVFAYADTPFTYQLPAQNLPTGYGLVGTLPPGLIFDSTTGVISGTPTQTGTFSLSVSATNAGGTGISPITLILSTAPVANAISLSGNLGTSIVLGSVPFNTTVTTTLTINNPGTNPLVISSISYPGGFSGSWSSGTIPAGGSQDITVTFAPTSAMGYGGFITVTSSAGTATIDVTAVGVDPPVSFTTVSDGNGGVIVTGYSGPGGAVAIPGTINGLTVTSVGSDPETSTGAFEGNTSLTSVTFPNSVTSIGDYAFAQCSNLRGVTIPSTITSIGNYAFANCSSLASVTIPASVISLGRGAFEGSAMTSVAIPSSVTSIGDGAFANCSALTIITVDPANSAYSSSSDGVLFDKNQSTLVQFPAGKIGGYTIPSSVTGIENYAFSHSANLTGVTIPNTVTQIGMYAFASNTSLTSVAIPNSVTSIGVAAFESCFALGSVTISNHLSTIPQYLFNACRSLTSVTIPGSIAYIDVSAFQNCSSLKTTIFLGNAPTTGSSIFLGAASGFTTEYYTGATGFTSPTWTDSAGDSYPALNLGNGTSTISLSGSLAFGTVTVNSTPTASFTIRNSGNGPLIVSSIGYPAGFYGSWSAGTIAAGSSQAVTVTFAPTLVATYGGTITVNSNASSGTGTIGVTVAGVGQGSATVALGNLAAIYNGSAIEATATTSPPNLSVAFTYNGSTAAPTNAGTYAVVGTITDPNYQGSATGTLVIAKAASTVVLGNLATIYSGLPLSVVATTNPANLSVFFTYDGSSTAPKNAGSYSVVATVNNTNYTGTATGTFVIAKATANLVLGNLTPVYNGLAHSVTATTNPANLNVSFTYDGSGTAPTMAGSYSIVATVNDTNYTGTATGTFVIGKATATVALGNLTATYSGSPFSATATTNPANLSVALTYDGGRIPPTNAGSYVVLGTISDSNYLGSKTGTLTITRAPQTITFPAIANQGYPSQPIVLNAAATSSLPIKYTVTVGSNIASVSGNTLTLRGIGSVTIQASQGGDSNYLAAVIDPSQSFVVTTAANLTFSEWETQSGYFTTTDPNIIGPDKTPQGDGIPNLLKYLYDINPARPMSAADRAALPVFGIAGNGDLTFTFREYKLLSPLVSLELQTSYDLKTNTWTTINEASVPTPGAYTLLPTGIIDPNTGDAYMQIDFKPTGSQPRQFFHLNVTAP